MPSSPRLGEDVSLLRSRLVIVSGKGGVGKTTVSAAIATAAAQAGKRVLLVEVEQREGLAPLFGRAHIGYEERALAPNITGLSVVPDEALVEYLYLFYGIGRIARPLVTSKAIDFATNTAPGLRDILLIGKVKEAENRRAAGSYVYDLIVLDAPPTGRLPRFLEAPRAVMELVSAGTIRAQAQGVYDMLVDARRTRVVLVTTPEDMPVREVVEGAEHMRERGIALGPVVVNALWPQPFSVAQQRALAKDATGTLRAEANGLDDESLAAIATVAAAHSQRAANQRNSLKGLDRAGLPTIELPELFAPSFGPPEIRRLGEGIAAQGAIA